MTTLGCKPNAVDIGRSVGCLITSRTITHTSGNQTFDSKSTWRYNTDGALIEYSNPQSVGLYPNHIDFKYDSNGFLIMTIEVRVYSGFGGFFRDTVHTEYSYVNGRLTQEMTKNRLGSQAGKIVYEYTVSGELTKMVNYAGYYGDTKMYTFRGGKLTDFLVLFNESKEEVRPYEITDGLITKEYARDRRYYTAYHYDELRRPVKIDRFDGNLGQITEYATYEYSQGKPYFDAIPLPKGWPEVARRRFIYEEVSTGSPVTPIGLPATWTRYATTLPGSSHLFKNVVKNYVHTQNQQGYPLRSEYVTTVMSPYGVVGTPSRITETYTYEECF